MIIFTISFALMITISTCFILREISELKCEIHKQCLKVSSDILPILIRLDRLFAYMDLEEGEMWEELSCDKTLIKKNGKKRKQTMREKECVSKEE